MKKLVAPAALAIMATLTAPAFAANDVKVESLLSNYTFTVGLANYTERYEEFQGSTKLMQEEANMTAIIGSVSRPLHGGVLTLSGSFASGSSAYTGAYWGGSYGDVKANGQDRQVIEVGASYAFSPFAVPVSFEAGVSYRNLEDHLDQLPGGYFRENDRVVGSLGVAYHAEIQGWHLTPKATYKHPIWGEQYADLMGGVTMDQDSGHGYDLSLDIERKVGDVAVVVTPYLRTFKVDASEIVSGMYEPENKTTEKGISVAVKF